MDRRLSKAKNLDAKEILVEERVKVYRNSSPALQLAHQSAVYRPQTPMKPTYPSKITEIPK